MKSYLLKICFCAIALICLLSCTKESITTLVDVPVISVTNSSIEAPAEGGNYSFSFSVDNPADDGVAVCSGDVTWLSDFVTSGGSTSFTIAPNPNEGMRSGSISVKYTYTYGDRSRYVTGKISVLQYGMGYPSITLESNSITASQYGGDYSFVYAISNPADDGQVSIETEADWISDINSSSDGTVAFAVDANHGSYLRSATITVTYTFDYGEQVISKNVTVVQDHTGSSGVDITNVVGTYAAHGTVYGNGISPATETDWIVRIYAYDLDDGYNLYIDGLSPLVQGRYNSTHTHNFSACAYYSTGLITIPSQAVNGTTMSLSTGTVYYIGYTPCVGYNSSTGGYSYNPNFPSLTFTQSEDGTWTANYGVFIEGCSAKDISTFQTFFQVVSPVTTFTLTKTSSTTSLDEDIYSVAHPITEGLYTLSNFYAQ